MKHLLLIKRLLALSLLLFVGSTALAYNFMVDGIAYNINSDKISVSVTNTGGILSNYANLTEAIIPESVTHNGSSYAVTAIGENAFYGCRGLISVTIGDSVKTIGDYAFYGCRGLISVTIPNSVTTIGGMAFFCCDGLTSMVVQNGNTKYDSRDNCNAIIETATNTMIVGCKNSIIPNSVTTIGDRAFWGCSGLTSVTIPNSVISIGRYAFYNCSDLTSLTIGASVATFVDGFYGSDSKYGAFDGCDGLKSISVDEHNPNFDSRDNCNAIIETATNTLIAGCKKSTIPNSVTSIGGAAFSGCSGLTSVIIPNSVTSIGDYAFAGCCGLTSLTIPNSVTVIGNDAFSSCGLTSIDLGTSVKKIGNAAFAWSTGLTSVTIPNSVISIGEGIFAINHLKAIKVASDNPRYDSRNNCNAIIETATNTLIAGCGNTIIPNTVQAIGNEAFNQSYGLTSITIPNSVKSIGYAAFLWCDLRAIYSRIKEPSSVLLGYEALSLASCNECVLHVPKGTKTLYSNCDQWNNFTNIVDEEPGDINEDGIVDVGDVSIMIDFVLGIYDPRASIEKCDLNGDGIADVSDVNALIDIVLGK